jgi:hypothetical protein
VKLVRKKRRSRMRMMMANDYGKGRLTLSIVTPSIIPLETQDNLAKCPGFVITICARGNSNKICNLFSLNS